MLICNDMYYFEMGMSPLQLHVAQRQWKLFRNSWNEMRDGGRCLGLSCEEGFSFAVHNIYCTRTYVTEIHRVFFTRPRVCCHSLAVGTGRWSRRGQGCVTFEERLCPFGALQTEVHVAESCPQILPLGNRYHLRS